MLLVEDAGVGDEGAEAFLVDAGQIVYRIASVACADCSHLSYIRLGEHHVSSTQVILHVLADVVTGNLLCPLLSESSCAAAVTQNHDVAL